MPKKTKKEKVIAELRRKLTTASSGTFLPTDTSISRSMEREGTETLSSFKPLSYNLPASPSLQEKTMQITKPSQAPEHKQSAYKYIFHDIRRIGFFTALAITLEAMLYLLIEKSTFPFGGLL